MRNKTRALGYLAVLVVLVLALLYDTQPLSIPQGLAERAQVVCADTGHGVPDRHFTTDGCSGFPDGVWQECCIEHDVSYWCGGTSDERKQADQLLKTCVQQKIQGTSGALLSNIIFVGVRLGGVCQLPTSWRWGYGRTYPFSCNPS